MIIITSKYAEILQRALKSARFDIVAILSEDKNHVAIPVCDSFKEPKEFVDVFEKLELVNKVPSCQHQLLTAGFDEKECGIGFIDIREDCQPKHMIMISSLIVTMFDSYEVEDNITFVKSNFVKTF